MSLYHPVRIGSLSLPGNLFLAPVAGYSDRAFRSVCRRAGADFAYTEMVSAEALSRGSGKTEMLLKRAPEEDCYGVQLFGGNPESMERAAAIVRDVCACELIDINAGCPVSKIVKTGAGSALLKDPERLSAVVRATVKGAGGIPVTVKIRSAWDSFASLWKEAAEAAIEAGAEALTLHPRSRAQGYEGRASWEKIAELSDFVLKKTGGRVPVFGSGDVFSAEAARDMLMQTGCSGVMFARGAMGNPFIFSQTRALLCGEDAPEPSPALRIGEGFHELDLLCEDRGEEAACFEMRKRFCAYSRGLAGGAELRSRITAAKTKEEYRLIFAPYLDAEGA